jgi:hypothetical protein
MFRSKFNKGRYPGFNVDDFRSSVVGEMTAYAIHDDDEHHDADNNSNDRTSVHLVFKSQLWLEGQEVHFK